MNSISDTHPLRWDLGADRVVGRVDWPGEITAFAVDGPLVATVTLPGGRTFAGPVARVLCRRDGDAVAEVSFCFAPESTEDSYARMTELGAAWNIDTHRIDEWFARRCQQRDRDAEDHLDTAFTGGLDAARLGGPDGPLPWIEALTSFNDVRPVIVSFSFTWPA